MVAEWLLQRIISIVNGRYARGATPSQSQVSRDIQLDEEEGDDEDTALFLWHDNSSSPSRGEAASPLSTCPPCVQSWYN